MADGIAHIEGYTALAKRAYRIYVAALDSQVHCVVWIVVIVSTKMALLLGGGMVSVGEDDAEDVGVATRCRSV